ncbi:hypothetical protein GCM10009823_23840 [Brevibacterium salitolerans]|uniref:Transposase n=1 Tax=Brevibacterium salitolerans TaxID=1403566 RepID=A0ABN2WXM1_9MICO
MPPKNPLREGTKRDPLGKHDALTVSSKFMCDLKAGIATADNGYGIARKLPRVPVGV